MRFRVLGSLEVVADDGTPVSIPAPKRRQLLAALLLSANRPVSVDALIEALWEAEPPPAAHESLQAHVSRLRAEIGAARIVSSPAGYLVRVAPGELDVHDAEAAIAEAQAAAAARRWGDASIAYERALELWRGEPLADLADRAVAEPAIARLDAVRLAALEGQVAADLERGRHLESIARIEELVARHPYAEPFWQQLMLALYRSGRQADALAAYRRLRHRLVADLGIDPSPGSEDLQARMLRHDPGLDVTPWSPDRVRLPVPRDPLIGREDLVERVVAMLREDRLVTVTGPGGVGKTRLAIGVATAAVEAYGDGVAFVDLSAVRDPGSVLVRIGEQIDGGDRPGDVIRDREMLLVLDNFEQVLDAAPDVDALLNRCRNLAILVTSRSPLRLRGEHRLEVPPLSGADASRLFVDRSRAVLATQRFDPRVVDEIVTHLDCLPLALELAAAQLGVLAPIALRDRLEARLSVLTGGPRDAPERHRTLRDTIAWSHDLLSPEGRAAFRDLSVFAGGFDLEAAEAVVGVTVETLRELVEHSLVRAIDGRYAMLETIREFATTESDAHGSTAGLRDRHLAYFRNLASDARWNEGVLPRRDNDWHDVCARERDNLRLAFEWAEARGDEDAVSQLFLAVGMYWMLTGAIAEGWRWAQRALGAQGDMPRRRRMMILAVAAEFPRFGGSLETALELKLRCLALAEELGDHDRITTMLKDVASVYGDLDDPEQAMASIARAIALHDEANCDPVHRLQTLGTAAELSLRAGRFEDARNQLEDLGRLEAQAAITPEWEVETDTLRGAVQHALGDVAGAGELFRRSITNGVRLELARQVSEALEGLAALELERDAESAARMVGMSDRLRAEVGCTPWLPKRLDATVAALQERLGAAAFAALHAEGHALGLGEIGAAVGRPE